MIVCRACGIERGEDPARCADCGSTEFDELQPDAYSGPERRFHDEYRKHDVKPEAERRVALRRAADRAKATDGK